MKSERVVVIDTGYDSYEYEEKLITGAGHRFEVFPGERHDRQGKIEFSKDAVGIMIRWTEIDDIFFRYTPKLRAIVRYGVGHDNIDVESAIRHGVKVSNVQGYASHSVSDHAIALMYACARALPRGQQMLKENFGAAPIENIFEFHDKTLGIIGLGRIGGTLCRKLHPLFRTVLAADPYISNDRFQSLGAVKTDLQDVVTQSDVISIHCNLTEETTNLIDAEKFNAMEKRPVLINTARGPVINEKDLLRAILDDKLHSVGLDVFTDEPPLTNRDGLLSHPKVIATGHYAWYSVRASKELQKRAADNLLAMLQGKSPNDCLNP